MEDKKDINYLELAKEYYRRIHSCLPKNNIYASSFTLNSKLPYKAASLRELIIYRVETLTQDAIELFDKKRIISAFIITRALIETISVIIVLNNKISSFLNNKKTNELDTFLNSCLIGDRIGVTGISTTNVLTLIDIVNKKYQGFREDYNRLSEFTHPNWSGVLGPFGNIDSEEYVLNLSKNTNNIPIEFGTGPLSYGLGFFIYYYNECASLIKELNEYFESNT